MQLTDVIKCECDNTTFVWKHPREDFNTGSQLIVHESQEAIFLLNGQALDSFGPGRHELQTANLPLANKIINLPTGGDSPFHAEVYFVNRTEQLGIPWGTNSKIQFIEPQYGFPLSIGASGKLGLSVENPRKLLVKIVGTEAALSQANLVTSIKAFLQARTKSAIAQAIKAEAWSIFEIDAHLETLSEQIQALLAPDLEPYGLRLPQFVVTTIVKPDGDPAYERMKELFVRQYADIQEAQIKQRVGVIDQETKAKQTVIEAQSLAQKRALEGYTYQQERGFDVASLIAQNEAVGEFTNAGVGLGMMTGVGASVGMSVSNTVAQSLNDVQWGQSAPPQSSASPTVQAGSNFCPQCGFRFGGQERFCPQCGLKRSGR